MNLSDRMKLYEKVESVRRLMPLLPVCIRADGRAFHSLTRKLKRPYDERFSKVMVAVTKSLVRETNALVGYTQSDEINLVLYSSDLRSQVFFDGKVQKLVSIIASMASTEFNLLVYDIPEVLIYGSLPALFDCRVWSVPTLAEAANVLLWRELDATRNSIQSATRALYSHKQCDNKNTSEMQEMLFQKGVNWNDYPDFFKRGTFVFNQKVSRVLTTEELARIPEEHRPFPLTLVERRGTIAITLPPLLKIMNRVAVLFEGATIELSERMITKEEDNA